MTVFNNVAGDNTYRGTSNEYDQVDYSGSLTDYTFTQNANGSVTVSHATLGTDTLWDINGFWLAGEQQWYSLQDALELAGNDVGFIDVFGVISGTVGDNVLTGTSGEDFFYGHRGDDVFDGNGNAYDQVEYETAMPMIKSNMMAI